MTKLGQLGKSRDYGDVIVFEKLRFASTALKRKVGVFKFVRFEERFQKLRFRDGLVWMVGLTVETKQCPPV